MTCLQSKHIWPPKEGLHDVLAGMAPQRRVKKAREPTPQLVPQSLPGMHQRLQVLWSGAEMHTDPRNSHSSRLCVTMVPVGRMGKLRLGAVTLSWDHVTGGQQGQKEMTESLSLDPMLQTKSLKVGYPRSRIIPPPPPRNLGLSVFGPTHVIRKIPGQRSSKPVPQESPLWLSRRESDS